MFHVLHVAYVVNLNRSK